MGYTTDFDGELTIEPPLNEHEVQFLKDFCGSRRQRRTKGPLFAEPGDNFGQGNPYGDVLDGNHPDPDQPGLWAQWVPSDDGTTLGWDGGEKFYHSVEWMTYYIDNLLSSHAALYIQRHVDEHPSLQHFTCDHLLNGTIEARGEDSDDRWDLIVTDNVISVREYTLIADTEYKVGEPRPIA